MALRQILVVGALVANTCRGWGIISMKAPTPKVHQVVLIRHGLSKYNKESIFTGWFDIGLAPEGKEECLEAGRLLAGAGFRFDVAHASVLQRACTSLHKILEGSEQPWVPIKTHWRLNERHYGNLQGWNKEKTLQRLGDIVTAWRRSYDVRPPPMTEEHPHWPLIAHDSRYKGIEIPHGESIADTELRVKEYWDGPIASDIKAGKSVLVVAHANSLRALVHHLDKGINTENIKLPTGRPFVYRLDENLSPVGEPDENGFTGQFVSDMVGADEFSGNFTRLSNACAEGLEQDPTVLPEECILMAQPSQPNGGWKLGQPGTMPVEGSSNTSTSTVRSSK
ncbi:unnamed protein product [Chrysoparadoxa australica]